MYEVTSLLRGIVRNPKYDDFLGIMPSQDFLVVGGEEKITVYFDNGASQSVDHNWINKLVESGGWKQGLTFIRCTIVESHFLKTTITKEVKTQPTG